MVPETSLAAGLLLTLRGRVSYSEQGDYEGAQEAFNESLGIARQQAKIAAVTEGKTLGQWLEEAIRQKAELELEEGNDGSE